MKAGGYAPQRYYQDDRELQEALDLISSGFFSHGDRDSVQAPGGLAAVP